MSGTCNQRHSQSWSACSSADRFPAHINGPLNEDVKKHGCGYDGDGAN
jgi:hypothetical protein